MVELSRIKAIEENEQSESEEEEERKA